MVGRDAGLDQAGDPVGCHRAGGSPGARSHTPVQERPSVSRGGAWWVPCQLGSVGGPGLDRLFWGLFPYLRAGFQSARNCLLLGGGEVKGFPRMNRTCPGAFAVPTGPEVCCKIAGLQAACLQGLPHCSCLRRGAPGRLRDTAPPPCPRPALGPSAQGRHLQLTAAAPAVDVVMM